MTIFWFRRDLRLHDNKGLYYALKSSGNVLPLFILDDNILDKLPRNDHRVEFFHRLLSEMDEVLRKAGSGLLVKKGKPLDIFRELLNEYDITGVFCNCDHEPYGEMRDKEVRQLLNEHRIPLHCSTDHLVMEKNDVLKNEGTPYLVFTPYSRKWKEVLSDEHLQHFPSEDFMEKFHKGKIPSMPSLTQSGFTASGIPIPEAEISEHIISNYNDTRDFPALNGTSRLGPQLRFGNISIRQLVKVATALNQTFLNELIWREFYAMILWHFPHVTDNAFKPKYDHIKWRNNEKEFKRWTSGTTGYPMVDAGMRQLNATGFMHNRLRMITAGFLTKHLLTDWRWGETYFAEKLFDYELSSNNGGWQWCAGTGTDAAPYFRIFNPVEQQKKFDPNLDFVKLWIPEYGTDSYPAPVVDHKFARQRCLSAYKMVL